MPLVIGFKDMPDGVDNPSLVGGVEEGDVIVGVNGELVESVKDVPRLLKLSNSETIELVVARAGKAPLPEPRAKLEPELGPELKSQLSFESELVPAPCQERPEVVDNQLMGHGDKVSIAWPAIPNTAS